MTRRLLTALLVLSCAPVFSQTVAGWEAAGKSSLVRLEIHRASVTKINESLVFDAYQEYSSSTGTPIRVLERLLVSCKRKMAYSVSSLPWVGDERRRVQSLQDRDTAPLSSASNLLVPARGVEVLFEAVGFQSKIPDLCRGPHRGLKGAEVVASTYTDKGLNRAWVVLLDTLRVTPKHREIWTSEMAVKTEPLMATISKTGEVRPVLKPDGAPYMTDSLEGTPLIRARRRYQCEDRTSSIAQYASFDQDGSPKTSRSYSEEDIKKETEQVVPGTVAEAVLDMVCAL